MKLLWNFYLFNNISRAYANLFYRKQPERIRKECAIGNLSHLKKYLILVDFPLLTTQQSNQGNLFTIICYILRYVVIINISTMFSKFCYLAAIVSIVFN